MFTRKLSTLIAILVFAAVGQASYADTTLNLDRYFSGALLSGGTWVSASFSDIAGGVQLTVSTTAGLPSGGRLDSLYLNLDPSFTSSLTFTNTGGVLASSSGYATNAFRADGDGYYDIRFNYPNNTFTSGGTSVYDITGTGLTSSSFIFPALPGPSPSNSGPFYAAGKVNNPGAWIAAVPEPETYAMLLAGLALMGLVARRRRQSQEDAA